MDIVSVGQHHSVSCAAYVHPLHKLGIKRLLFTKDHEIIQFSDIYRCPLGTSSAYILNGFSAKVSCLERDDFVCAVFNDFVADFGPHGLLTVKNRLPPFVIVIEPIDFGTIL